MAAWTLRRFSNPSVLDQIHPERLLAFLRPFRDFLASRGVALPAAAGAPIDKTALAQVFLSPDVRTPGELIDALHFVDELATPEGMDALLREARARGLALDERGDLSPADVVVQVWLLDRALLERKHVESYLERVRSFASFRMARDRRAAFRRPTDPQFAALTAALDDWFEERRRGRWARVIVGAHAAGVWFLVRHGEPLKREESLVAGAASSICHRPIKYDVLVYDPHIGELQVNACTPAEKELYRTAVGTHLFGDPDTFPGTEKYTLEPLRRGGPAALATDDVAGIEAVTLREVQLYLRGDPWELVTRKSSDFFQLLAARAAPFPEAGALVRATFAVKFAGSRKPRTVVIKPSNVAQFTRDEDAGLVERWLEARGFIRRTEPDVPEHDELAVARG